MRWFLLNALTSFNPEPAATADGQLRESYGLDDRSLSKMIDGDTSAVAAGSGLNEIGLISNS
jgi:hypothetical protein